MEAHLQGKAAGFQMIREPEDLMGNSQTNPTGL